METITLTETEVAYICHKLFKYAMLDEDVAKVCRLLSARFPGNVVHSKGKYIKVKDKKNEQKRVQGISTNSSLDKSKK